MKYITFLFSLLLLSACQSPESDNDSSDAEVSANDDSVEYQKMGMEAAQATFKVLSGQLKSALQSGGVQNAVEYCNIHAYPLTDSLSEQLNAKIKRVSLQYRNPNNKPDSTEIEAIVVMQQQRLSNEKMTPQVIEEGDKMRFFAPIVTQALCLNCHGVPGEQISDADYAFIKEKYPDDMAIGFSEGDLRGIWSITFQK